MSHFQIALEYVDEIRMGPAFYRLMINGKEVKNRRFFKTYISDDNNGLLAITEYSTQENLMSILWVLDLNEMLGYRIADLANGLIVASRFEGTNLIYIKEPIGGISHEFERSFLDVEPQPFNVSLLIWLRRFLKFG